MVNHEYINHIINLCAMPNYSVSHPSYPVTSKYYDTRQVKLFSGELRPEETISFKPIEPFVSFCLHQKIMSELFCYFCRHGVTTLQICERILPWYQYCGNFSVFDFRGHCLLSRENITSRSFSYVFLGSFIPRRRSHRPPRKREFCVTA